MQKLSRKFVLSLVILTGLMESDKTGFCDDTCIFGVTPANVPPNVVMLVDNGTEMEQIQWHNGYDNQTDYTPVAASLAMDGLDNDADGSTDDPDEDDVTVTNGNGSGFFFDQGYAIIESLSIYYLVRVRGDLTLDDWSSGLAAQSSNTVQHTGTWNINGRTVTLRAEPSTGVDAQGVNDNAAHFRYSKNYLNWIFFGPYTGDGADLPDKSRLYEAKKALFTVGKLTANKVNIGVYAFTVSAVGGSQLWPLGPVVTTPLVDPPENNALDSGFVDAVNNLTTVTYSPLAEGLANVGGYYATSGVVGFYCQKNFAVVVSPGISSEDQAPGVQSIPANLEDFDGDSGGIGEGNILIGGSAVPVPTNQNGSTYLDDVAYYLYSHDVATYQDGYQNVITYTLGFMSDSVSDLFLINTSNNGNGNVNLYDSTDSKYGKYHFSVSSPDQLSTALLETIGDIISRTSTFTAPVIPVTRTTSGNRIYLSFFQTSDGNFWEGNVTKFGVSENKEIVDRNGSPATWPNGAIKEDAEPYWATRDWADPAKSNYIHNSIRNIYTYLGSSVDLTAAANAFRTDNAALTTSVLGSPVHTREQIIEYLRGADVLDEDGDGDASENRKVMTGDVLHSEPAVVRYKFPDGTSTTMVYFGSNDGMLHAVVDTYGSEAWAFIPPDQLHRLKEIVEGSTHQYFVDSSPKIYIKDANKNGVIETADGDLVILVCGERKGGAGYFALDLTDPFVPYFLWRISRSDDTVNGSGGLPPGAAPTVVSGLGQSWSEPQFGLVKTSDEETDEGTAVFFIGGGYSSANSFGRAVVAVNVLDGSVVRIFENDGSAITGMSYSFASNVSALDTDNNGFVDKVYVGDLGGQMWRLGKFTDSAGDALPFPKTDENIQNWDAEVLFLSDSTHGRKFFYPPSIALEKDFDLVFMGTGDREEACDRTSSDRIYVVKDSHISGARNESDLVDVTLATTPVPDLSDSTGDVDNNGWIDRGWYIRLDPGEKALSEGLVFLKAYYVTTFTPNDDPCLPGGVGKLYALDYLTGGAVLAFGGSLKRSEEIGGGIPSKPVMVITGKGQKLFVSTGSTNPDAASENTGAGILAIEPFTPSVNFFYLWWMEQ